MTRAAVALCLGFLSVGCSWVHVTHCTYWNILPALGIDYVAPVCPGGQPTQTVKPPPLPVVP